jgi:uncharacterized protein (TIGR04222 family)
VNPFDLRGPEFLVFFAGCIATVVVGIWVLRRLLESAPPPRLDVSDPGQLAFLREGPEASVEVALVSLIDRGLLVVVQQEAATGGERTVGRVAGSAAEGARLVQSDRRAGDALRRPFEQAVFAQFAEPRPVTGACIRALAASAREHYEEPLRELGLLVAPATRLRRILLAVGGVAALWLIAGTKVSIALGRGRSNVGFLILLAIVGSVLCLRLVPGRSTVAGTQLVQGLRELFGRLRGRASSIPRGGATNELSVLVALFGLAAVPVASFPHREVLQNERLRAANSSAASASSGSSCGSGGCGGGGAGCGGGGGCGGCGGCGS